jgi:S1-C subfamily serine protease
VELLRSGKQMTVTVKLAEPSKETPTIDLTPTVTHDVTEVQLGVKGEALTDALRQKFKLEPDTEGVVLIAVDPDGLRPVSALRRVTRGDQNAGHDDR